MEDCVQLEKNNIAWYVKNSIEPLLCEVGKEIVNIREAKEPKEMKDEVKMEHEKGWKQKSLHGKLMEATRLYG